ncbi:MAG: lysophospholipid acyltransferase family protein [Planctomycetota bacterium]|nr:lysophospholipid acyltransferase family protein [Planctomycetota bacterium]
MKSPKADKSTWFGARIYQGLSELVKDLFYRWVRNTSRTLVVVVFGFRTMGRQYLPSDGNAIFLSTHQSMLDPVLVGLVFNGKLNYIARKSLFHQPLFAFLIRLLDAIEIDRERGGLAGLREMMKRLHDGKMVLIFPEGTRTADGEIGELKLGFLPIARKTKAALVPMAIAGAIDVLPRKSKFPQRYPIAIVVGKPISYNQLNSIDDNALMVRLKHQLDQCKSEADFLTSSNG